MNAFVVILHVLILGNFVLGDDDTGGIDASLASAILATDGGGGGGGIGGVDGGNGGGAGGGAGGGSSSVWEQIFGAEAKSFGGINGSPLSMSFLQAAMADMGDNIGMLALLQSMNSKSSSKGSAGMDLTSDSLGVGGSAGMTSAVAGSSFQASSGTFGGGGGFTGNGIGAFGRGGGFTGKGIGALTNVGMGLRGGASSAWKPSSGGIGTGISGGWSGWGGGRGDWKVEGGLTTGTGVGGGVWSGVEGGKSFGLDKMHSFPKSNFIGPNMAGVSSANALLNNLVLSDLSGFQRGGRTVTAGGGGSLNANINTNAILSALFDSKWNNNRIGRDGKFIEDRLLASSVSNLINQQNIASIISSLQRLNSRDRQRPIVVIGVDRFGEVKHLPGGRGKFHSGDFDFVSRRGRDFQSRKDWDKGFKSIPRQDSLSKDINLNIIVKHDRPSPKPIQVKGLHFDKTGQRNDFRSVGNSDLNWLEFNHAGTSAHAQQRKQRKGPALFSFKNIPDIQQRFGSSLNVQSFWKDSSNGAQLKPIPKLVAKQQLANFMQGTNRGDMWKQIGQNKGMAISEHTAQSPGFVPADSVFGVARPETQFEHTQQIIAYPKKHDQISHPVFKVPRDFRKH